MRRRISKTCLVIGAVALGGGLLLPYALGLALAIWLTSLMCVIALALGPNPLRLAGLIGLLAVAASLPVANRRCEEYRRLRDALRKASEEYQAQRAANQALEDTGAGAPSPQR